MTQKSRKGIVGKKIPTTEHRQKVGAGISFTDEHVFSSKKIQNLADKELREEGLK